MATTLPTLTRTLDDDFTNVWYEIQADAVDNILDSTIVTLALKEHGCLTPQVGGEYVTRTVRYGEKSTQRYSKGGVLTQTVKKIKTMARWDWRYFLVDVNRSLVDDMKNRGPFKIADYLSSRLEAARDAVTTDLETYLTQWGAYYAGDAQPNGLYDIVSNATAETAVGEGSASDTSVSGTSNGNINKTNPWWRNWTMADGATASSAAEDAKKQAGPTTAPYSLNLVPDMRHMFNKITAQREAPNFILMDEAVYEAYEDEVGDKQQIVRNGFNKIAGDLGFDSLTFKGATVAYSSALSGDKHIFMLNLNHIELPYHPDMWFDMVEWRTTANQLERVTYIACMTPGLITAQPRRSGVMEYAS